MWGATQTDNTKKKKAAKKLLTTPYIHNALWKKKTWLSINKLIHNLDFIYLAIYNANFWKWHLSAMWRGHHAGSLPSGSMRLLAVEKGAGQGRSCWNTDHADFRPCRLCKQSRLRIFLKKTFFICLLLTYTFFYLIFFSWHEVESFYF